MSKYHRYSSDEDNWLLAHAKEHATVKSLTGAFNQEHNTNCSIASVRQHCVNYLGLSFGEQPKKYTEAEDAFLIANYGKYPFRTLANMLYKQFGHKTTWSGIRGHMYLTLGMTLDNPSVFNFQNARDPIGTERDIGGYIWVKVSNEIGSRGSHSAYRSNWKPKHRIIWEENNGPIPDGYQVVFLDGNKRNLDLDNLYCINKKLLIYMIRNNWWTDSKEHTLTAIKLCELMGAIKEVV